ncbi:unnamed protein product [Paramecium sonneborni]|uniref:Uncharacterized protein n=1 Tax=Paramecium sonneborni TaxID=65129 RepID=A0A8S1KJ55_9CILI|nr:unnamed protein product [Paramecium sonneborni]
MENPLYLGYINTVKEIKDQQGRTVKILKFRFAQKYIPFVYLEWVKGPCQKSFRKGRWYRFRNYEIEQNVLLSKLDQEELNIQPMREPYSNILGIIEDVGELNYHQRSYPQKIIRILKEDGITQVELKLKNQFAIKKEEQFKVGNIIYIQECKYQGLNNNQMDWYSTLTKNTKIQFDLDVIRQHVPYERLESIKKLNKMQIIQEEITGQIL